LITQKSTNQFKQIWNKSIRFTKMGRDLAS